MMTTATSGWIKIELCTSHLHMCQSMTVFMFACTPGVVRFTSLVFFF